MSPTHDLKHALATVTEADRPAADPALDLARARAAASTRTRRRFRTALGGLAAVAVLGVAAATLTDDDAPTPPAAVPSAVPSSGVQLVAETFDASPFTFDLTPEGWSVQGQRPQTVTIAPDDGSTSDHPDDFEGKLVIMFDENPPPSSGRTAEVDGRTVWIYGDSGYTTVATRTRDDEPDGMVRVQYPNDTAWDEDTMVAFLASVHVGPGAVPGVG